jgi:hypothetical protein
VASQREPAFCSIRTRKEIGVANQNDSAGQYGSGRPTSALTRLALESLVDAEFYARLREDPVRAAESLGIELSDTDAAFLNSEVHWAVVDAHIDELREALHLGVPRAGPLW